MAKSDQINAHKKMAMQGMGKPTAAANLKKGGKVKKMKPAKKGDKC